LGRPSEGIKGTGGLGRHPDNAPGRPKLLPLLMGGFYNLLASAMTAYARFGSMLLKKGS
jgi:hypothetical protein